MMINEVISEKNIVDVIGDFLPLAMHHLGIDKLPKIHFVKDVESKHQQPTFGVYHHSENKRIDIDIENRHPVDIIRTLAHELVHYKQDLEGRLTDKSWQTGSSTENEAHEEAGVMLRQFNKKHPEYLHLKPVVFSKGMKENFADGKKPGRKGLAKRSGVNCKASVSTLRNVAKNSSGEKQRMAHWCANMKSGRKK